MPFQTIIQISDTHLTQNPHQLHRGQDADQNLLDVLALIKADEKDIDALLVTGDIANEGDIKAYQRLADYLQDFPAAIYFIPGNHDQRANLKYLVSHHISDHKRIDLTHWQIILLDSLVPGQEGGALAPDQLDFLNDSLAASRKYKLIALHHHPICIHHPMFDKIGLANAASFLNQMKSNADVKGVLFGHIHQEFFALKNNLIFLGCPSTWLQIKPAFEAAYAQSHTDTRTAGYRWLRLFDDGTLESGVRRISS